MTTFFNLVVSWCSRAWDFLTGAWVYLFPFLWLGYTLMTTMTAHLQALLDRIAAGDSTLAASGLAWTISWTPYVQLFQQANTFVPLDWAFSSMAVYLAVVVVCAGIRILKSFVPSISG